MSAFSIWPDYEAARELLSAAPAEQGAAEWVALRRVGRAMATAAREGRRADGSAVDAAFCDKAEELTVASLLRANLVAAASVVVTKKGATNSRVLPPLSPASPRRDSAIQLRAAHATITHRPFLDRVGAIFSIGARPARGMAAALSPPLSPPAPSSPALPPQALAPPLACFGSCPSR